MMNVVPLIDWISDTRPQGCTDLQMNVVVYPIFVWFIFSGKTALKSQERLHYSQMGYLPRNNCTD